MDIEEMTEKEMTEELLEHLAEMSSEEKAIFSRGLFIFTNTDLTIDEAMEKAKRHYYKPKG